jgi:hypothetical protein
MGQAGESAIAKWLRGKGYSVMPVYEKLIDNRKGPQIFTPTGSIVAPDLFTFRGAEARWIEAKHKSAFTLHKITGQWTTGIDLRLYEEYQRIDAETSWPVWLLFLQEEGQAKYSPKGCPTGLFGGKLSYLVKNEHHRHMNHGTSGMVYWAHETLRLIAPLSDVRRYTVGET